MTTELKIEGCTMEKNNENITKQDRNIRSFLWEIRGCQVPRLAAWAYEILERKDRTITIDELARLFKLGF